MARRAPWRREDRPLEPESPQKEQRRPDDPAEPEWVLERIQQTFDNRPD